jgi:hypothetical protein|nr:MAG TPA: hypothetical protein [Caudoviricetes sp.]
MENRMIKCEGGKVELEEDANKLLSELTAICRGLRVFLVKEGYSKEKADELVSESAQMGLWTDEKIQEELDRLRTETLRTFAELISGRKIFEGGKEND